jgi:hypothetical protein
MSDRAPRLGDEIDDYCPRCRLLLNHDITSLFDGQVAKATCRTCHNTHDYRHGEAPPKRSKKNDKKALLDQVLATMPRPPEPPPPPPAPSRKKRDLWAEVERIKGLKKD